MPEQKNIWRSWLFYRTSATRLATIFKSRVLGIDTAVPQRCHHAGVGDLACQKRMGTFELAAPYYYCFRNTVGLAYRCAGCKACALAGIKERCAHLAPQNVLKSEPFASPLFHDILTGACFYIGVRGRLEEDCPKVDIAVHSSTANE